MSLKCDIAWSDIKKKHSSLLTDDKSLIYK